MRNVFCFALLAGLSAAALLPTTACTTTKVVEVVDPSLADGGTADGGGTGTGSTEVTRVEGKSGKLFDQPAKSFANVNAEGVVVGVGVVFSMKGFTSGPADHPFQDDLVIDMPSVAKEQTMLNHLRANWLAAGHGPDPYGEPHFDFHFLRGTRDEIDAIDCRADKTMPKADKIPSGYGPPELCVNAMGYHSWPKADTNGGSFIASNIMGYWKGNVIFLEPMIPLSTLEKKKTFEIAIPKPQSAGGASTLYPTKMVATWLADTEEYSFEFVDFETID